MASTAVVFDILAKDRASDKFDHLGRSVDGTSGKMAAFTGVMKNAGKAAAVGLGAGLVIAAGAAVKFAQAAAEDEQSAELMATAFRNNADATDGQIGATERWITAQGKALGVADDQLRPALSRLITSTKDVGDAQKLASLAMDVSAGSGKSLESVSTALMKANNGQVSALSRLGINTKNAAGETISMREATKRMADTFGGAASAKAGTLQGKMDRLKVMFDETKESIGSKLIPIVSDLADWFLQHAVPAAHEMWKKLKRVVDIAWPTISDGLDAIADAGRRAKEKISGLVGWFQDLQDMDAGQIGEQIGSAIASGLDSLITLAGTVTQALGKMFAKVDWVGLGIAMGKQVPAMLVGLAVGILAFDPLPLLQGLADHWQEVLIAVLTIAFAPSRLAGGLGKLLSKIPFVGKFLEASVRWLNELGGKVASFGADLFGAMWKGFTGGKSLTGAGVVAKVLDGIKGLPNAVRNFIEDLKVKLYVWSVDAFHAIGTGAGKGLGAVIDFVLSIPGKILRALGDLARLLFPKGVAVIEGMAEGFRARWEGAVSFFKGIPGRVVSAVGNLGGVLVGAGRALLQGLYDGIVQKWNEVKSLVGSMAGWIKDHKGPPSKDAVLLKPAGVALMQGLIDGLESGKVKLTSVLEKLTDYIKKHQDRLAKLLDKRRAIVDAFKGFASSIFGADVHSEDEAAPKGLDALLAFQADQKVKAQGLLADVKTLISKGISKDLLTQLQDAGSAGEEQIHLLAGATADQLAQANADNAATLQALQAAGLAASEAQGVEAAIRQEEANIKLADTIRDKLAELLDLQDKNTVVELHLDGQKIYVSLKKLKKQLGHPLEL